MSLLTKFGAVFFIFFLAVANYLNGEISYWQGEMIRSYVHNSELQRRWAWSFLAPHLKEVPSEAKILDIGCGDGKITADIAKFVPKGQVVGIDPSESMLNWAKRQHHAAEYFNVSFQKGSFLNIETSECFDWVVSFSCNSRNSLLEFLLKFASNFF